MRNSKRTILAFAPSKRWSAHFRPRFHPPIPIIVAPLAKIVRSEAKVASLAAAEHALPDNIFLAVFLAAGLSHTDLFEQTVLAEEILRLVLLFIFINKHLLFAIYKSAKVGLFALIALIKRAFMIRELLRFIEVSVANSFKSFIFEDPLSLRVKQGFGLDLVL